MYKRQNRTSPKLSVTTAAPTRRSRADSLSSSGWCARVSGTAVPSAVEQSRKRVSPRWIEVTATNSLAYHGALGTSRLCMHSLDVPSAPWYASEFVAVTSIHLGDTRFLLCSTADGTAVPLTRAHHPDEESESARLRRVGAAVVTDSFGEVRFCLLYTSPSPRD